MGGVTGPLAGTAIADLVLAVMAGEFALLLLAGHGPRAALAALLPGALLVLALRAALAGADWRWIALALALSLPAHLADLRSRGWWRSARERSGSMIDSAGSGWRWRGS